MSPDLEAIVMRDAIRRGVVPPPIVVRAELPCGHVASARSHLALGEAIGDHLERSHPGDEAILYHVNAYEAPVKRTK